MTHDITSPCSCANCQMIDIMWGDPLLNPWEHRFVDNLSRWGWEHDYTVKQRTKLLEIFARMKSLRTHA